MSLSDREKHLKMCSGVRNKGLKKEAKEAAAKSAAADEAAALAAKAKKAERKKAAMKEAKAKKVAIARAQEAAKLEGGIDRNDEAVNDGATQPQADK